MTTAIDGLIRAVTVMLTEPGSDLTTATLDDMTCRLRRDGYASAASQAVALTIITVAFAAAEVGVTPPELWARVASRVALARANRAVDGDQ
jgi:hypothetical protein